MKFTCDKNILLKEISMAQDIIASKNVISISSYVYLFAENDFLFIRAKDLKINFETKVPVTVIESGPAMVLGEKFLGILSQIPEGEMDFEYRDNKVKIKTSIKKINYQLKSLDSDKFSELPVSDGQYFEMPIKSFKEMINQTVFAVSTDESRLNINGVYMEYAEKKLVMAATDGRRLAFIEKDVGEIIDFPGVVVHTKILNIIRKRAGDEGLIAISITNRMIFIRFGSYNLSSVLLEGQFPNYRKVIPEKQSLTFSVLRTEMLDAIKRVTLLVEQKSNKLFIGLRSGKMLVYSEEGEIGDASEEIPCRYDGEDIDIAFNYTYIEEPFKAIASDEIRIKFNNPSEQDLSKAITIFPVPESDYFHVVMPMQS